MSEPEPLHFFETIEGLLNTEVDDLTLPAYCQEQSDIPSTWNVYWTEAAAYGGGLALDVLLFVNSWTEYWGAHRGFKCDPDLPCECEGQSSLRTHSMEGYQPAAPATANPLAIPLIVIEPPTQTPAEIDA